MMATSDDRRTIVWAVGLLLTAAACATRPEAGGRNPELDAFLESYFATWSAGDMTSYGAHFHERAVVSVVRDGVVAPWASRDRFVEQQRLIIERSAAKSVERMTSYVADQDDVSATVVAQWELTRGAGVDRSVSRGVDRFTLVKNDAGEWRIAALLFYTTE
jgi:hypothetical protein